MKRSDETLAVRHVREPSFFLHVSPGWTHSFPLRLTTRAGRRSQCRLGMGRATLDGPRAGSACSTRGGLYAPRPFFLAIASFREAIHILKAVCQVLALVGGAQKVHDGDVGVFVSAVHAIQRYGSHDADSFQLSSRDSTGCVPDVSVVMPSTRAAQPMRTEEDFVRVGRLKNTLVRVKRVSSG